MHECDCKYIQRRGGSESLENAHIYIHILNDWHILLSLLLKYNAINYYVTYENPTREMIDLEFLYLQDYMVIRMCL